MKRYYGLFEYDSFVIRLLPLQREPAHENKLTDTALANTAYFAKTKKDSFVLESLSSLSKEIKEDLFHETLHWWQSITTSFILNRFLASSKLLQLNAVDCGFKSSRFSDTLFPLRDRNLIFELDRSAQMNFQNFSMSLHELSMIEGFKHELKQLRKTSGEKKVLRTMKSTIEQNSGRNIYEVLYGTNAISLNAISDDPAVAMPFFMFQHLSSEKKLPGYLGILDYFYYVDFSVDNIIESITHVNECLYSNREIPVFDASVHEDHKYLGVWEFYRRMHGKRYSSDKEMAISFLALADLALINDPHFSMKDPGFSPEAQSENSSLSYRFGKIVYRAQGFKTFTLSDEDAALSIRKYQDEFCAYSGMALPDVALKRRIVDLILVVANDLMNYYRFREKNILYELLGRLVENEQDNWDSMNQTLHILNDAHRNLGGANLTINHKLVGVILNAVFFKLNNRGKLVVPYLYFEELDAIMPKPLIIFQGKYFSDLKIHTGSPYEISYSAMEMSHQFLGLHVSKPIVKNKLECGFLTSKVTCWYQSVGLGCAFKGLQASEQRRRDKWDLQDWCHWKHFLVHHEDSPRSREQ